MSLLRQAHIFFILSVLAWTSIAQTHPGAGGAIQDDKEILLIGQLSEEQLNEEMIEAIFAYHVQACMDAKGSIPYNKKVELKDDKGKVIEVINCAETAALQFQILTDAGMSHQEAVACTTQGWHPEDRLSFVKELGLKVDEVLECPGKDVSNIRCMGEFACGAIAGLASGGIVGNALTGGKAAEWVGNWASEKFNIKCSAKDSLGTLGACATEIVWGVIKNVITSLEFVVDGIKWIGKKLCFWCDDEHESASSDQQHLINSSEVLNEAHNGKGDRDGKEDSRNIFEKMWDGLKNLFQKMVADPAMSNFGCARWEESRFTNINSYNIFDGKDGVPVRCAEPVGSWDCATCRQRAQVMCGIAGFVGGEIITSLVTGKIIATAGKTLVGAGKAFAKTSSVLGKGLKSIPGMNRVAQFGRGQIQVLKSSKAGMMAVKIGDNLAPLGEKLKNRLGNVITNIQKSKLSGNLKAGMIKTSRGLFDSNVIGRGVKGYFRLLDEAFAFGAGGRNGLIALRTARDSKRLQNSIFLAQREFKDFPDIMERVAGAGNALNQAVNKFDNLIKESRSLNGAAKEAKMKEARKLADEIAGFRKSFDEQYKLAHQKMQAEKTRLAKEAAEKAEKERLANLAKNKENNVVDLGNGVTLHMNDATTKPTNGRPRNYDNVEDAVIVDINGKPVAGNNIAAITDPSRLLPAPSSRTVFDQNLEKTFGTFDNANMVVRYQADGVEVISPTLKNVRFENDYIVGTNAMTNADVKIPRKDVQATEFFYTTKEGGRGRHVVSNKPLSNQAQSFTDDIAKASSGDPSNTISRFQKLSDEDKLGVVAHIDEKIANNVSLTSDEFITRLSYEPGSGYRGNNGRIAHQDDLLTAFNNNDPNVILRSYGDVRSRETIGIRDMAIEMVEKQKTATVPVNRSLTPQNTAVTTVDNVVDNSNALVLRSDNAPAVVPAPVSTGRTSNNLPNSIPKNKNSSVAPVIVGSTIAGGVTEFNEDDVTMLDEVVIVAPSRKPGNDEQYSLTVAYTNGQPIVCSARVNKRENGQALLDSDGSPVLLPHAEFATKKVEVKWSITKGSGVGDAVCANGGDLSDEHLLSCPLPNGVEQIQATLIHDGKELQSLKCPANDDLNPNDDNDGDDDLPYDIPTPAPTDDDIEDPADTFFENQRSPPPSLFQPINIPPRPNGYLHGGWY